MNDIFSAWPKLERNQIRIKGSGSLADPNSRQIPLNVVKNYYCLKKKLGIYPGYSLEIKCSWNEYEY